MTDQVFGELRYEDDNGIGVCLLDEEIAEIAYKDIAFQQEILQKIF